MRALTVLDRLSKRRRRCLGLAAIDILFFWRTIIGSALAGCRRSPKRDCLNESFHEESTVPDSHFITSSTKVAALLEEYPELEDVLMAMAPPFKKLRNPFLRKSVAKVASLGQRPLPHACRWRTWSTCSEPWLGRSP